MQTSQNLKKVLSHGTKKENIMVHKMKKIQVNQDFLQNLLQQKKTK